MRTIFYRILGNDIPVRHRPAQTLTNLSFILKHEPELPGCEKRFLLNHIVDPQTKNRLIAMIRDAGLSWEDIPFVVDDYRKLTGPAERALYLTNQNAARNRCIRQGLADGNAVMPFDGQVFFREEGYSAMIAGLNTDSAGKYLVVPMFRLRENPHALLPWRYPDEEVDYLLWAEPQIVVRRGHDLTFNESLGYGNANKVELLMRLGIKGPWDGWERDLFRNIRANLTATQSQSFGRVREAGFVFRLASGNWKAERSTSYRVQARKMGLEEFIAQVDRTHLR
ncbi:MAG: hypothetical protein ACREPN_10155 [Rudaea sp.]